MISLCLRHFLLCTILFLLVPMLNIPLMAQEESDDTMAFGQLIEAPTSPLEWKEWEKKLKGWKEKTLRKLEYSDAIYRDPGYQWASKAYSMLFLIAFDQNLYDQDWNFQMEEYLENYEANYGGVDIVLLWPTYPQLGFDNRDQFEFYRNLPGGTEGLRELASQLHSMGKRLFIAYNPWDNIGRLNGKNDEEELIKLVKETGADGIFLDTITSVKGFLDQLKEASPGVILQSEIATSPEELQEIHQSWLEIGWSMEDKYKEFLEVPPLIRNRWLEQRHMLYRLSRWSHEQSAVIQNAWMNGSGMVIWENVFGSVNPLNPRDKTLLRTMLPLQRHFSSFFTEGEWSPLVETHLNRVYASLWQRGNQKLWTIVNRQEQRAKGPFLKLYAHKGMRYFDLIKGEEVTTSHHEDKIHLHLSLLPRELGSFLAIPKEEVTEELLLFLEGQGERYAEADFRTAHTLPQHTWEPYSTTKRYPPEGLPENMAILEVPEDSINFTFSFRRRECGFYPMEGVVDHTFVNNQLHETVEGRVTQQLKPFAMDKTLVTNAEFKRFLEKSGYVPKVKHQFLAHWENGNIPKGKEEHPVTFVSLEDARAYAAWAGKRLPTEAEWQWAAQNGNSETQYPWGNAFDPERCNHGQFEDTSPVTYFKNGRTVEGIYDMSGNVWQWTESERSDGHNRYAIVRGGAWYETKASGWYADQGPQRTHFGAKYLFSWPGLDRCGTVGFRCVVDLNY